MFLHFGIYLYDSRLRRVFFSVFLDGVTTAFYVNFCLWMQTFRCTMAYAGGWAASARAVEHCRLFSYPWSLFCAIPPSPLTMSRRSRLH